MCVLRRLGRLILTWKDSAEPFLALILGSLMVARLVPLMVNRVPPLTRQNNNLLNNYVNVNMHNKLEDISRLKYIQLPALGEVVNIHPEYKMCCMCTVSTRRQSQME